MSQIQHPLAFNLTTTSAGNLYDLATGATLRNGSLSINPGEGKFIFQGSASELATLRANTGTSIQLLLSLFHPQRQMTKSVINPRKRALGRARRREKAYKR